MGDIDDYLIEQHWDAYSEEQHAIWRLLFERQQKLLVGRARPQVGGMLVLVDSSSFPSAHSAQAVATYGALAYLAGRAAPRWGQRVAAWTAATLIVLLVGFSRLYLGVHWLSDVLGGFALGAGWLAVVITASATYRRLRAQRPPPPGSLPSRR